MRIIFMDSERGKDQPFVVIEEDPVAIPTTRMKTVRVAGKIRKIEQMTYARYTALHVRPASESEWQEWQSQR